MTGDNGLDILCLRLIITTAPIFMIRLMLWLKNYHKRDFVVKQELSENSVVFSLKVGEIV